MEIFPCDSLSFSHSDLKESLRDISSLISSLYTSFHIPVHFILANSLVLVHQTPFPSFFIMFYCFAEKLLSQAVCGLYEFFCLLPLNCEKRGTRFTPNWLKSHERGRDVRKGCEWVEVEAEGEWNERDPNTILLSLRYFTMAGTHYIIITLLSNSN